MHLSHFSVVCVCLGLLLLADPRVCHAEEAVWKSPYASAAQALQEGRFEDAAAEHESGLELAKSMGVQASDLARAEHELGDAYVKNGRTGEALACLERALSLWQPSERIVAEVMANTAVLYRDMGNAERAESRARQAHKLASRGPIPSPAVMGQALNVRGNLASDAGQPQRALDLYLRALPYLEDVYGPDHPKASAVRANLANAYLELDRPDQAVSQLSRLIKAQERRGEVGIDLARAYEDLGFAQKKLGDLEDAARSYEAALKLGERFRPDDPGLTVTLSGLAMVYRDLGKPAEAKRLFERSLELRERLRGPQDLDLARSLYYLGVIAYEQQQDEETRKYFERSLSIWEEAGSQAAQIAQMREVLMTLPPAPTEPAHVDAAPPPEPDTDCEQTAELEKTLARAIYPEWQATVGHQRGRMAVEVKVNADRTFRPLRVEPATFGAARALIYATKKASHSGGVLDDVPDCLLDRTVLVVFGSGGSR